MAKQRRHFDGPQKVAILKQHLVEKVPISDLCDQHAVHANQIYDWLKKFFENGHVAFDTGRKSQAADTAKDEKIEKLEAKLARRDSVMAELLEAHTLLKKEIGEI